MRLERQLRARFVICECISKVQVIPARLFVYFCAALFAISVCLLFRFTCLYFSFIRSSPVCLFTFLTCLFTSPVRWHFVLGHSCFPLLTPVSRKPSAFFFANDRHVVPLAYSHFVLCYFHVVRFCLVNSTSRIERANRLRLFYFKLSRSRYS